MAWAVVETKGFGSTLGADITSAAFTSPVGVGNLLVLVVTYGNDEATIQSISDNGSGTANSWTWIDKGQATDDQYFGMAWCVNARTNFTTVTVTFGSDELYEGIIVREYSGNHASPADGSNSSTGSYSNGDNVILTGLTGTGDSGDLIVAGAYSSSGANVSAGDLGGTFENFATNLGGDGGTYLFMESRVRSDGSSVQGAFDSSTAGNQCSVVFAFKPAGGGGPGPPAVRLVYGQRSA